MKLGEETEEKKYGKFENYEIEDAARTLADAEEIKADEEKMKYVEICLKKNMKKAKKAYKSLNDIKEEYSEKCMEEDDD